MSTTNPNPSQSHAAGVLEQVQVKRPPRYAVWMLNDDYTPMDFVIDVLQRVFRISLNESTRLMWVIHTEGQAKCGTYSRDIAQTKVKTAQHLAAQAGHPLRCTIDVEDSIEN